MNAAIIICHNDILACICSSGTCTLHSFIPPGWENCDKLAETSVAQKTTCQVLHRSVISMTKIAPALKRSHQTIVRFGCQRSANVPPIKEKRKIGAHSATDIQETASASPPVFSMT